jgi:hypothetical protein
MSALLNAFPIPDIPIPGLEQMTRFMNRVKVLGPKTVMRTVGTNPAEAVAITLVAHRDRHTLAWSDEALLPCRRSWCRRTRRRGGARTRRTRSFITGWPAATTAGR